jgi:hypothetical protein
MDATSSLLAIANTTGRRLGKYAAWAERRGAGIDSSPSRSSCPVTAGEVDARPTPARRPSGSRSCRQALSARRAVLTLHLRGAACWQLDRGSGVRHRRHPDRALPPRARFAPSTIHRDQPITNLERVLARRAGAGAGRAPSCPPPPRQKVPFDAMAHAARGPSGSWHMGGGITEARPLRPRTLWQQYQPDRGRGHVRRGVRVRDGAHAEAQVKIVATGSDGLGAAAAPMVAWTLITLAVVGLFYATLRPRSP